LYVLPIRPDMNLSNLGDFPGELPTDQGDEAFQRARDRAILRLTPSVLNLDSFEGVTDEHDEFEEKVTEALKKFAKDEHGREWVRRAAQELSKRTKRLIKPHPLSGFVVIGKRRLRQFDPTIAPAFIEAEQSWESVSDCPVPLAVHCADVASFVREFANQAALTSTQVDSLQLAGLLHDAGKADPRFQAWLHNGNRRKADLFPVRLAKSIVPMPTKVDRDAARQQAGYPKGGRHELHSVRLAECDGVLPTDSESRDLILHLIASHHGYCRPFAPVIDDAKAETFSYASQDGELKKHLLIFAPDTSANSGHGLERIDSGVADRFWKLTRRYGWWGLAWLESMLRLADWAASDAAERTSNNGDS
jgi:CRISPR-associated endonuclease/helicase Cas3